MILDHAAALDLILRMARKDALEETSPVEILNRRLQEKEEHEDFARTKGYLEGNCMAGSRMVDGRIAMGVSDKMIPRWYQEAQAWSLKWHLHLFLTHFLGLPVDSSILSKLISADRKQYRKVDNFAPKKRSPL